MGMGVLCIRKGGTLWRGGRIWFYDSAVVMTLLMARLPGRIRWIKILLSSLPAWIGFRALNPPSPWWSGFIDLSIGDRFNGYVTYNDTSVQDRSVRDGLCGRWCNSAVDQWRAVVRCNGRGPPGAMVVGVLVPLERTAEFGVRRRPFIRHQHKGSRRSGSRCGRHWNLEQQIFCLWGWQCWKPMANWRRCRYCVSPRTVFVLLLGLGIAGLAGCRRIVKRHKTTTS